MRIGRIVLVAASVLFASVCESSEPASPESVVRAYAASWNAGDLQAFLSLQSPDIRKFRRNDTQFALTTVGRDAVRRKYEPLFAQNPRVRVEIVSITQLGDLVICRDRVSGGADPHVSHELTMYEVRDGTIQTIWYLGREQVADK